MDLHRALLGRRRYLPDLTSDNRQRREMAERPNPERVRMLLQVHDVSFNEVTPTERDAVESLVREHMAAAADLTVPLDVSVGVGRTWQEAGH